MTAASAVTGFSEKTGSLSEKNGMSDNPVTVKKHYRIFTVYESSEDPETARISRHRILSY